jgi:hypothetical protein
LGQTPPKRASAHVAQKVHSNEQIMAPGASGGRSASQHSQLGFINSMTDLGSTVVRRCGRRRAQTHRRPPGSRAD